MNLVDIRMPRLHSSKEPQHGWLHLGPPHCEVPVAGVALKLSWLWWLAKTVGKKREVSGREDRVGSYSMLGRPLTQWRVSAESSIVKVGVPKLRGEDAWGEVGTHVL